MRPGYLVQSLTRYVGAEDLQVPLPGSGRASESLQPSIHPIVDRSNHACVLGSRDPSVADIASSAEDILVDQELALRSHKGPEDLQVDMNRNDQFSDPLATPTLSETQQACRYFINGQRSTPMLGGIFDCYDQFPLGIEVGSPVRAVVMLDGQVEGFDGDTATFGRGAATVSVSRRCLGRRGVQSIWRRRRLSSGQVVSRSGRGL